MIIHLLVDSLKTSSWFIRMFLLSILLIGCNQQAPKKESEKEIKKDTSKVLLLKKVASQKIVLPQKEFVRFYNDKARFIAGMESEEGSDFSNFEKNQDWKQYAAWYNNTWTRLEKGQLQKIKSWSEQELMLTSSVSLQNNSNNLLQTPTIFYPFSGADFLYATTLFPSADQYVMIGLEPVGKVPDIRKIPVDFWENYFLALRTAQDDILTASFFKTKDMKVDFRIQELKGTLPILMIFLTRTGNKIITMEPVQINDSGKVVESRFEKIANHQFSQMNGIRITFEKDRKQATDSANLGNDVKYENVQKTLYYFSIDLSDNSLIKKSHFESFMNNFGEVVTFIKSASYLMHQNDFSMIRKSILNHSSIVLQDDSGIPLKYFTDKDSNGLEQTWSELTFYGAYKEPIRLFKNFYQEDLKKNYADSTKTKPLPFRIGYQNQTNRSNLMLAKKNIGK